MGVKLECYTCAVTPTFGMKVIGVDPGSRNMGLALLDWDCAYLYQLTLPKEWGEDPVGRIFNLAEFYKKFLRCEHVNRVVVEGPSFNSRGVQIYLEQIRTVSLLALRPLAAHVNLAYPISVRKEVFGNVKTKADLVWPHLPRDAAAALACALWGLKRQMKELKRE